MLDAASAAIAAVRKAKTEARMSMRTPVRALAVTAPGDHLALLAGAADDVRAAGRVEHIELRPGTAPGYDVSF